MKTVIRATIAFVIGFILPAFVYWLAGNDLFVRSKDTAGAFIISMTLGGMAFWIIYETDIFNETNKKS